MIRFVGVLVFSFACLGLSGCATERLGPRPELALPLPDHLDIELRLSRQEVAVRLPPGNAGMYGGGLLGALIDTAVSNTQAKRAETSVSAIRDLMADVSLSEMSLAVVSGGLDSTVFGSGPQLRLLTMSLNDDVRMKAIRQPGRVLVLEAKFEFDYDFTVFDVALVATLERRIAGPGAAEREIEYVNTLTYRVPLTEARGVRTSREVRAGRWVAMGRDALLQQVQQGLAETVAMLNFDIGAIDREERRRSGQRIGSAGVIVKTIGDRVWRRDGIGTLTSAPATP